MCCSFFKVNRSWYIALFVFSRSMKKPFSIDWINTYVFSIFFFHRFYPVIKCGITQYCLFCNCTILFPNVTMELQSFFFRIFSDVLIMYIFWWFVEVIVVVLVGVIGDHVIIDSAFGRVVVILLCYSYSPCQWWRIFHNHLIGFYFVVLFGFLKVAYDVTVL